MTEQIQKGIGRDEVARHAAELIADGFASNNDMMQIETALRAFGLRVDELPYETRLELERARARRDVLVSALKPIESPVRLKSGETLYGTAKAAWYEPRSNRGVYELELQAAGVLYLTDDRAFVIADRGLWRGGRNSVARWESVVTVRRRSFSSMELERASGRSPIVEILEESDTVAHPSGAAVIIAQRCHRGQFDRYRG